ncbi:MAG: LCP family protein [Clostridiales bacterium]|nr:LCP family protein [Clostridiales bacterium]
MIVCLAAVLVFLKKNTTQSQADDELSAEVETPSQAIDNTIEWKGKTYTLRTNLTNILFLGIDSTDPIENTYAPGDAGQADCIMILSLDEDTKEGTILQINRNTMTSLDVYDYGGDYLISVDGQLCLQYAYDIGGQSSCWAMKKTVSSLLYGLDIDGYFAMEVDAISTINDALGGIDITMSEDYTYIDPGFIEGETVHLEGDLAERFVRYRDTEEFNSVEGRMKRQVEYITAMISTLRQSEHEALYDIISPWLGSDLITDLTAEELNALSSYTYLTDEVQYLPGEMRQGEVYEEYYVDEDALQDLLIELFYTEVK